MEQPIGSSAEDKLIAILKILGESSEPLGSINIARLLENEGIFLSERAVRYHLKIADERGFTQLIARDGRMLTSDGQREVKEALASQRMGFVREKLDMLAYQTTLDPEKRTGLIPINTALIDKNRFKEALSAMSDAFRFGMCVSDLVAVRSEDEKLGSVLVPRGKTGIATVCGVSISGVLLKAGIPTDYKFGGVLEIRNHKPRRFVVITDYSGTSMAPSEQFIRARMTSVGNACRLGNGKVTATFCTMPAPARKIIEEKIAILKEASIGGVCVLGKTSESVCQIPVTLNRIGMVQIGGLNPIAAAVESGIEAEYIAESGLLDFQQLQSFWKL